jgi:hypothetical protein
MSLSMNSFLPKPYNLHISQFYPISLKIQWNWVVEKDKFLSCETSHWCCLSCLGAHDYGSFSIPYEPYFNLETRVFHPLLKILNTKLCCGITMLHPCISSTRIEVKNSSKSIRKMYFLWNSKWTLRMYSFSYKTRNFNFFSSSFQGLVQVLDIHFVLGHVTTSGQTFNPLCKSLVSILFLAMSQHHG